MIFDNHAKLLVLKRGDEGHHWDLPGGHLKEIEVKRGDFGIEEGLEREVLEETTIENKNNSGL